MPSSNVDFFPDLNRFLTLTIITQNPASGKRIKLYFDALLVSSPNIASIRSAAQGPYPSSSRENRLRRSHFRV